MSVAKTYRLPEITVQQIDELTERTGMTQTMVVVTAIDRMYHQNKPEGKTMNTNLSIFPARKISLDSFPEVNEPDRDILNFRLEKLAWVFDDDQFCYVAMDETTDEKLQEIVSSFNLEVDDDIVYGVETTEAHRVNDDYTTVAEDKDGKVIDCGPIEVIVFKTRESAESFINSL